MAAYSDLLEALQRLPFSADVPSSQLQLYLQTNKQAFLDLLKYPVRVRILFVLLVICTALSAAPRRTVAGQTCIW